MKPKPKFRFVVAAILVLQCTHITARKVADFLKLYCHTVFQGLVILLKSHRIVFLHSFYCPLQLIRKYAYGTAETHTDVVLIPNFVKIDYLVWKLRET